MRHIVRNILKKMIVLLAVLSVISCVQDYIHSYEKDHNLLFDIAIKPSTKSSISLPSPVVWAQSDKGKTKWMEKEPLTKGSDGYWHSESYLLWPKGGVDISFVAASPQERFEMSDFDNGLSIKDYDYSEKLDLLYTRKSALLNADNWQGPVPLVFEHALTLVEFKLCAPSLTDGTIIVKKLITKNIDTKGDFFSEPKAHWSTSSTQDLELFNGEKVLTSHTDLILFKDYLIPISKTLTLALICDIKSEDATLINQELECSVNAVWDCGKYVTYLLKISPSLNLSIDKE